MEGIRRVYRHYCELSMFVQLVPLPENWLACDRFHPGIMIASTAAAFFGKPLVLLPVEQVCGNSKHNGNTPEQKLKTEET